jgi:hypothetical protein
MDSMSSELQAVKHKKICLVKDLLLWVLPSITNRMNRDSKSFSLYKNIIWGLFLLKNYVIILHVFV